MASPSQGPDIDTILAWLWKLPFTAIACGVFAWLSFDLFDQCRHVTHGMASQHWQRAAGVIEHASSRHTSGKYGVHIPTIRYRYLVDGQVRHAERINASKVHTSEDVARLMSRYRPGALVTVLYDRASGMTALEAGVPEGAYWRIFYALVGVVFSACILLLAFAVWTGPLPDNEQPAVPMGGFQTLKKRSWLNKAFMSRAERQRLRDYEDGIEREIAERKASMELSADLD